MNPGGADDDRSVIHYECRESKKHTVCRHAVVKRIMEKLDIAPANKNVVRWTRCKKTCRAFITVENKRKICRLSMTFGVPEKILEVMTVCHDARHQTVGFMDELQTACDLLCDAVCDVVCDDPMVKALLSRCCICGGNTKKGTTFRAGCQLVEGEHGMFFKCPFISGCCHDSECETAMEKLVKMASNRHAKSTCQNAFCIKECHTKDNCCSTHCECSIADDPFMDVDSLRTDWKRG